MQKVLKKICDHDVRRNTIVFDISATTTEVAFDYDFPVISKFMRRHNLKP